MPDNLSTDDPNHMSELGQDERLDLVARGEATRQLLHRTRLPMTAVSAFIVLLAVISSAPFTETLAVRIMALIAILATAMIWLRVRYAIYALPALFFIIAGGTWIFDDPDYRTTLGSTTRYVVSLMVAFAAYRWWTNARPFLASQSEAFDRERSEVKEWLNVLLHPAGSDHVIEFSTKIFWSGYWTYRLLRGEGFWAVAKFKLGNTDQLLSYRVMAFDAVTFTEKADGGLVVTMGDRSVSAALSSDMRERLSGLVQPEN